jgi:hypothetical protein
MKPWIAKNEQQHPLPVDTTPEEIDFSDTGWMSQLERQRKGLIRFHEMKNNILSLYPSKVSVVPTEIFADPAEEYIPILNSLTSIDFTVSDINPNSALNLGLNYQEKYTNYNDLKAIVDSWDIPN